MPLPSPRLPLALAVAAVLGGAALLAPAARADYPLQSGQLVVPAAVAAQPVAPGQAVPLSGGGFEPGTLVQIFLHSQPILLETIHASSTGAIAAQVRIPASVASGHHTLEARGAGPGGGTVLLTRSITVRAAGSAAPQAAAASPHTSGGGGSSSGGGLPFTGYPAAIVGLAGAVLLVAGVVLRVRSRRRRLG